MSTTTAPRARATVCADELVDQLLTRMLWDRRAAALARTHVPDHMYAGRAAVAALIADHDEQHPDAPQDGPGRVTSIFDHMLDRRDDVERVRAARRDRTTTGPGAGHDPYGAVAAIAARAAGRPDPTLLARAGHALTCLPLLAAPSAPGPDRPTATLIRLLRGARIRDDLT